jgi:hypothetical protein
VRERKWPLRYTLGAADSSRAGLVKLADTLALGASGRKAVQVRVLYPAPSTNAYRHCWARYSVQG